MRFIDSFCNRKHGIEPIAYDCPEEEKILKVTYGIPVYQEQVMQIFQYLAGFSLGEADLVRRAMGKKDKKTLMAQKEKFINGGISDTNGSTIVGCVKNGITAEVAAKIFADMEGFASYAFNKSHAAAYATLAYQTAWLKKYYIKEFICALLNNRLNKIEEITKYVLYLKDKGIKVLPPDINKSKTVFSVQDGGVRFGLSALKGTGQSAIDDVIAEREKNGEFKDFPDFVLRCAPFVNKRIIEGLILAGAFDSMGIARSRLFAVYDEVYSRATGISKQKNGDQMSLFGEFIEEEKIEVEYPDIPEYDVMDKLSKEKQVLGVYVSGHPFDKYKSAFKDKNFNCSMLEYTEDEDGNRTYTQVEQGMQVEMGGIISAYRRTTTKRSGAIMAFVTVEDVYGSVECVAFPAIFERVKAAIANDKIVTVRGKLDLDGGKEPSIILDDLKEFDVEAFEGRAGTVKQTVKKDIKQPILWLNATALSDVDFDDFVSMLSNYEGGTTCAIVRGNKKYKLSHGINYCRGLLAQLGGFILDKDIKYIE